MSSKNSKSGKNSKSEKANTEVEVDAEQSVVAKMSSDTQKYIKAVLQEDVAPTDDHKIIIKSVKNMENELIALMKNKKIDEDERFAETRRIYMAIHGSIGSLEAVSNIAVSGLNKMFKTKKSDQVDNDDVNEDDIKPSKSS